MINGAHVILYAKDAAKTRAFFRDTLGLAHVDAGDGWLIFALPPTEVGIHPDETGGRHQLFLMCDDVKKTRKELERKGVKFIQPIADRGWGLLTAFDMPGTGEVALYEPKHPLALEAVAPARIAEKKAKKAVAVPRTRTAAKRRGPKR